MLLLRVARRCLFFARSIIRYDAALRAPALLRFYIRCFFFMLRCRYLLDAAYFALPLPLLLLPRAAMFSRRCSFDEQPLFHDLSIS